MSKKVMIVDDSRTIRQQVNFTLSKGGYEVVEAEDGQLGLDTLKSNSDIAMVISDVNMPNMNGLEMVEAIAADDSINKTPVIMLTTEGSGELVERAKAAGAKGWELCPRMMSLPRESNMWSKTSTPCKPVSAICWWISKGAATIAMSANFLATSKATP